MQDITINRGDTGETGTIKDSLLEALVALTRLHHKPFSAESLIAGLPLEAGLLTPDLFVRAAQRAGFHATHLERELHEITTMVLPASKDNHKKQVAISFDAGGVIDQAVKNKVPLQL